MLEEIRNTLITNQSEKVDNKVDNKKPNKSEEAVLRLLLVEPHLTVDDLAKKTALSIGGIKKALAFLKANNWIAGEGSRKSGFWRVLIELN